MSMPHMQGSVWSAPYNIKISLLPLQQAVRLQQACPHMDCLVQDILFIVPAGDAVNQPPRRNQAVDSTQGHQCLVLF